MHFSTATLVEFYQVKNLLTTTAFILAIAAAPAFATNKTEPKPPAPTSATAGAVSGSKAIAKGGSATANGGSATATGGKGGNARSSSGVVGSGNSTSSSGVIGSGNSAVSTKQAQGQSQNTRQSQVNGQANSQTSGQSVNVEGDTYEAAAYAPDVIANSTADCIKGYGISFGTVGATGGISLPMESGNCVTTQRTALIAALGGNETALLYLAQNDPALWATLVAQGKIIPAERQDSNPLRQSRMPRANVVPAQMASGPICEVKPGTTRTVVTNYADKMACARELGLAK